jgi:hypothetical protein
MAPDGYLSTEQAAVGSLECLALTHIRPARLSQPHEPRLTNEPDVSPTVAARSASRTGPSELSVR